MNEKVSAETTSIPTKPLSDFEGPIEIIPPLKWLLDVRKFFRTRRAVLDGMPVYDMRKSELSERELMGPWTFNATQTALSAVPTVVLSTAIWLLQPNKLPASDNSDSAFDAIADKVHDVFSSGIIVPLTLMIAAYCLGKAALWKKNRTADNVHRARRFFLYADGTYGFYPQMTLSFCLSLLGFSWRSTNSLGLALCPVLVIAIYAALIRYSRMQCGKAAFEFFKLQGYFVGYKFSAYAKKHLTFPPYAQFSLAVLFTLPIVTVSVLLLGLFTEGLIAIAIELLKGGVA